MPLATLPFNPDETNPNDLFIAAINGNGFIVDAIVSTILTLCKSFSGPVLAGECGKWSLIICACLPIASFVFPILDKIPPASISPIFLPNSKTFVISSTILTIIPAIALPNLTPIFSAAPPVSSTGLINFLNQPMTT